MFWVDYNLRVEFAVRKQYSHKEKVGTTSYIKEVYEVWKYN